MSGWIAVAAVLAVVLLYASVGSWAIARNHGRPFDVSPLLVVAALLIPVVRDRRLFESSWLRLAPRSLSGS
jgi:hypothetical protein